MILADSFSSTTNLVQPLISGVSNGAAYGLLGLGLVLLYKSNRIFNFAQGEFAGVGALVAYMLYSGYSFFPKLSAGWEFPIVVVVGVAASTLVALLTERVVVRPLFNRPRVVLVVGTIGVALFLIGVEGTVFSQAGSLPTFGDVLGLSHPYITRIDAVPLQWQDLLKVFSLLVLAAASFLFFRRSRTGTAILAVSQDATAARVVGISVERISSITWAIAGLLGGIAGILLATPPAGTVTPGVFTQQTLLVGFSAAVLGGMTSLPGAFVGGMVLGLVEAFANADHTLVPGLASLQASSEVVVAVLVLVVLLVRPRGLLGKEA